jgi:hypothetical protein
VRYGQRWTTCSHMQRLVTSGRPAFISILNLVFGIFFVFLGLFFLYFSVPRLYQLHLLEGDVTHGSGVVKKLEQSHGRRSTSYMVGYDYPYGTYLEHAKEAISGKTWSTLKQGDSIPIVYVKASPTVSRVDLPGEDHWQWQNSIGVAAIAGLFVAIGTWVSSRKVSTLVTHFRFQMF